MIDCEARAIYETLPLQALVILDRFDAEGLALRRVAEGWWREDLATHPGHIGHDALFASSPRPLSVHDGIWLAADAPQRREWPRLMRESRALADALTGAEAGRLPPPGSTDG